MRIDFHPAAIAELDASAIWYAERDATVASRFALAIDESLSKISKDPQRFQLVAMDHRACSVANFPFQVVYRYRPDRITIVAVAHAKRRPDYWKRRT